MKERYELFKNKGFTYNPETGDIITITKIVSNRLKNGYKISCVKNANGKVNTLYSHQLAWYLYYGEIIEDGYVIDHINKNKMDNRIVNLRKITKQQNHFNTNAKGYTYHKKGSYKGKYTAKIMLNYKSIVLGRFNTEQEARQAYLDAKKIYHNI